MAQSSPVSLGSLVSLLNTHVESTSKEIESLTKLSKEMVPEDIYNDLIKTDPIEVKTEDEEEEMIREQERIRLLLILALQQQDFISARLQEMVTDSEQVVHTVINNCRYRGNYLKTDEETVEERRRIYRDTLQSYHETSLEENIETTNKALAQLQSMAYEAIRGTLKDFETLESKEYSESLDKVINSLNKTFQTSESSTSVNAT